MFNFFYKYLIAILTIIIFCFIGLTFSVQSDNELSSLVNFSNSSIDFSDSDFLWPTPRI